MHDLVVRGGTVVDGTGHRTRTADVAVDEGLVVSSEGRAGLAREVRGKVLAIRRSDYIFAAEVSGASSLRIIFKHIIH